MTRRLCNILLTGMLLAAATWGCLSPLSEQQAVGEPRSSQWPKVRAAYLKKFPTCAACGGGTDGLQVHHVLPFKAFGQDDADGDGVSNELDEDNLISLCTADTHNDHLWIGHAGNFKTYNPNVRDDARRFREMLANRKPNN